MWKLYTFWETDTEADVLQLHWLDGLSSQVNSYDHQMSIAGEGEGG